MLARLEAAHLCLSSRTPRQRRRLQQVSASATHPSSISDRLDLVSFSFILDDLVYPDGTTLMAQPGGGGPQTLWGYQLQRCQDASVGIAAQVGPDMPPDCRDWLVRCGIDVGGLLTSDVLATPRAWQVLENDGRRAEIWRTLLSDRLARMLRPAVTSLPAPLLKAKAYHLAVDPAHPDLEHLEAIRRDNPQGLLSLETFTTASTPLTPLQLSSLMSLCHVFSPNEAEALSMLGRGLLQGGSTGSTEPAPSSAASSVGSEDSGGGRGDCAGEGPRAAGGGGGSGGKGPSEEDASEGGFSSLGGEGGGLGEWGCVGMTRVFLEAGAGVVALRRGPRGAVVHSREEGAWSVPAVEGTRLVDTTGCGNAFCGTFLAALAAGEGLAVAGAWGCVAGSIMAEHRGVPQAPPAALHEEAMQRLAALLPKVQRIGD